MCEPFHEVLIVRRVTVPSQYLGPIHLEWFDTPYVHPYSEPELDDCTDAEIEEVWTIWERQGLVEVAIGPDGTPGWLPTPVGTQVLGWER